MPRMTEDRASFIHLFENLSLSQTAKPATARNRKIATVIQSGGAVPEYKSTIKMMITYWIVSVAIAIRFAIIPPNINPSGPWYCAPWHFKIVADVSRHRTRRKPQKPLCLNWYRQSHPPNLHISLLQLSLRRELRCLRKHPLSLLYPIPLAHSSLC